MKIEEPDYQVRTIDTKLNDLCLTFFDGITWKLLIGIPNNEHVIIWDYVWERKKKVSVTIAICKKTFSPMIHEGKYEMDEEDGYLILKNNKTKFRHFDHKVISGDKKNLIRWDVIVDMYRNVLVRSTFGKEQIFLDLGSKEIFKFQGDLRYLVRFYDLDGIAFTILIPDSKSKIIFNRKQNGLAKHIGEWLYKSGVKSYLVIETYQHILDVLHPEVEKVHL
jgi:hypothetical protein